MSFAFTHGMRKGMEALAAADLRILLVMTDSDVEAQRNAEFLDDIDLDEYDGINYVRKTLTGEAAAVNLTDKTFNLTATSPVWTNLGAGAREAAGAILFIHVTNDADSIPIAYYSNGGFPVAGDGTDFTLQIATLGLMRAKSGGI